MKFSLLFLPTSSIAQQTKNRQKLNNSQRAYQPFIKLMKCFSSLPNCWTAQQVILEVNGKANGDKN